MANQIHGFTIDYGKFILKLDRNMLHVFYVLYSVHFMLYPLLFALIIGLPPSLSPSLENLPHVLEVGVALHTKNGAVGSTLIQRLCLFEQEEIEDRTSQFVQTLSKFSTQLIYLCYTLPGIFPTILVYFTFLHAYWRKHDDDDEEEEKQEENDDDDDDDDETFSNV